MDNKKLNEDILIGEKIRQIRVVRKVSQGELGEHLGLAKQTISKIEKGTRKVTVAELLKIGEFFEVDSDYFFGPKKRLGKDVITVIDHQLMEEKVFMTKKVKSGLKTIKPIDTGFFKLLDELVKWSGHRGFTRYIKDYLSDEGLSREEIDKTWEDTGRTGGSE